MSAEVEAAPSAQDTNIGGQLYTISCNECRRRRQKCDRVWPCAQCQKRKVAEICRFSHEKDLGDSWKPSQTPNKLRKRSAGSGADITDEYDVDNGEGLESIGYGVHHLLANLGDAVEPKSKGGIQEQFKRHPSKSPQLQRALDILPDKTYIDLLVQNFLDTVNFYYYIVYPPKFLAQYHAWWRDRLADRDIGLPWTCLLVMICACSAQHSTVETSQKLKTDLGRNVRELANLYHDTARELHSAIPVGQSHIYTVQYLLHSCYWFKAEARFVECWDRLGAAIREGQMLGLHQDSSLSDLSEFDKEMCRRLWCILDAWDWLVSALLQRPMLIDRAECNAKQPALRIEGYPTSPLLHIRLQSVLVSSIFKRFGPPSNIQTIQDIQDYVKILDDWMTTFPPEFYFENPDTSHEDQYPWIALHRHYLHTTALSMSLGPLRGFMAKHMTQRDTSQLELDFRASGVDKALALMTAVHKFLYYVWERDTTFHFVPFCIFDTAALLCSSILHDDDDSIPRRPDIVDAVTLALTSLRELSSATNTAKTPCDILRRLAAKIKGTGVVAHDAQNGRHKRHKVALPQIDQISQESSPPSVAGTNISTTDRQSSGEGSGVAGLWDSSDGTSPASHTSKFATASSSSAQGPLSRANAVDISPSPESRLALVAGFVHDAPETDPDFIPDAAVGLSEHQMYSDMGPANFPDAAFPTVQMPVEAPLYDNCGQISLPPSTAGFEVGTDPASTALGTLPELENEYLEMPGEAHLGDLAKMWNWQSLNLDFVENPMFDTMYSNQ